VACRRPSRLQCELALSVVLHDVCCIGHEEVKNLGLLQQAIPGLISWRFKINVTIAIHVVQLLMSQSIAKQASQPCTSPYPEPASAVNISSRQPCDFIWLLSVIHDARRDMSSATSKQGCRCAANK
jgi:hypothetical protein